MCSYTTFGPYGARTMISCLFIVLLNSACGSTPPNVAPTPNGNTSMSVRVLSPEGIHCSVASQSPLPDALVLDTSRLNYDSVTIQKMVEYLDNVSFLVDTSSVPAGFKLVSVVLPQEIKSWHTGGGGCEWALQITNMDEDKTIQLGQLQMRLHALPLQDRYSFVDICSLHPQEDSCPPVPVQGGGGKNYTYDFDLGTAKADRVIQGRLTGEDAYDPTLAPGKTVEVDTIFTAPASAGSISYAITPEITVNMLGEQRILPIEQLQTTISLVTVQQLSCYTLHGNTFEPLPPKPQKNVWCL